HGSPGRAADDRAGRRDDRGHALPRLRRGAAARRVVHRRRSGAPRDDQTAGELAVARKLPGFRRELDARALFSVAYGEIASSIYFALGVLAANALGFTPIVLLGVGALFLIVSLSYAEGTAALPETGGAATFVRRATNDLFGFMTGWSLFLDYL